MAMTIYVSASGVWDYFHEHKEALQKSMHKIAGNSEFGVEIFVTEDSGLPNIIVTVDEAEVHEESVLNECDCEKTVKSIYDTYLTNKVLQTLSGNADDDLSDLEIEDIIEEREDELNSAVYDFMAAVMPNELDTLASDIDDIIEDIKDHFIEYLARKYGFNIYRPMFLEYEDGVEDLSEYPYGEMIFDDEDNPIYKS